MRKHHKVIMAVAAVAAMTGIYVHQIGPTIAPQPTGDLIGIEAVVAGVANPDVTQDNIADNICSSSWSTKSIRPSTSYTGPLKARLLANGTGVIDNDVNPKDYELDHLIALTDGGNPTDPNNLWLQPYNILYQGQPMGAREKDKFELQVHKQICDGSLTLQQGQDELRQWWKYYAPTSSLGSFNDSDDQ